MNGAEDTLNRARALQQRDDWAAALALLEKGRAQSPRSAEVRFELGRTLLALKRPDEAATAFRAAIRLKPHCAGAHLQLGHAFRLLGRLQHASRAYERAVSEAPDSAPAWYCLGTTRQLQDQPGKAAEAYRRTLALDPRNAAAENNLGLVLQALGQTADAIAAFRRALQLNRRHVIALANLGAVLQHENRHGEAVDVLQQALAIGGDDARAYGNLGNAYIALNRPADAIAAYEQALQRDPAQAHRYNLALARLVSGDLERGWEGYDSRLETPQHASRYPVRKPRWQPGEPLGGRTLLLYADQGLGDTLQFYRYVPMVAALGAPVVLQVPTALKTLLEGQGVPVTVVGAREPLPAHDLQCSLLSLPRHFGIRLGNVPAPVPYLAAPPAKLAQWRDVFARAPGAKVGLVWAGNPKHQYDHNRSVPLARFCRLTRDLPAHFFAIQKEVRAADRPALAGWRGVTSLERNLASFGDTAAIVAALDLVITVDTAVAHLAGALGKPAWVLLSHYPDWRWLLGRSDSPWYPTLRLFRQETLGDWEPVIDRVRAELAQQLAGVPA
jgi:tetratricopeptide (TPR) repeat protein